LHPACKFLSFFFSCTTNWKAFLVWIVKSGRRCKNIQISFFFYNKFEGVISCLESQVWQKVQKYLSAVLAPVLFVNVMQSGEFQPGAAAEPSPHEPASALQQTAVSISDKTLFTNAAQTGQFSLSFFNRVTCYYFSILLVYYFSNVEFLEFIVYVHFYAVTLQQIEMDETTLLCFVCVWMFFVVCVCGFWEPCGKTCDL
jgi:hypothetical protein